MWSNITHSLKYERSKTSGCKYKGIKKLELAAKLISFVLFLALIYNYCYQIIFWSDFVLIRFHSTMQSNLYVAVYVVQGYPPGWDFRDDCRECILSLFLHSQFSYFQMVVFKGSARGFNGPVNIPESCDFRSQFDPLNIICKPFSFYAFCRHIHFEWKCIE